MRTPGGVRVYTPKPTAVLESSVRAQAITQIGKPCLEGPLAVAIAVGVPVPPSWSQKRRREALAGHWMPTGKPDADNVLKLLCDALNGVLWVDDAQLVDASISLRYAAEPGAVIAVEQIGPEVLA
jgi:Holliday junction resolvase RusA-like endonuclease